jgi:hypothetical protein
MYDSRLFGGCYLHKCRPKTSNKAQINEFYKVNAFAESVLGTNIADALPGLCIQKFLIRNYPIENCHVQMSAATVTTTFEKTTSQAE